MTIKELNDILTIDDGCRIERTISTVNMDKYQERSVLFLVTAFSVIDRDEEKTYEESIEGVNLDIACSQLENQSNAFLKFWRKRLSHECPHLAIWVKLSLPVWVRKSSIVSMKNDWKDLPKFTWLVRAAAINSLSWVSGLIFIL